MGLLVKISPFVADIPLNVTFIMQAFDNTSRETWLSNMFHSNQRVGEINKQSWKKFSICALVQLVETIQNTNLMSSNFIATGVIVVLRLGLFGSILAVKTLNIQYFVCSFALTEES